MSPKRILITGAGGQIAYSLLFRIASGALLGPEQPVSFHLHDVPEAEQILKGVALELEDSCFPLLREVKFGQDPEELFLGVDYAILLGAKPRGPGMERSDLLASNGQIFASQGELLSRFASKDVKVLVVGNPCNTNCLIALHNAPSLNPDQFFSLARLDQNRAIFQLALKAHVKVTEVERVAIWGNHSNTQVPDFFNARIQKRPVGDVISDQNWLEKEFPPLVQKRGSAVIELRGKSSAASAATAILDSIFTLVTPDSSKDCMAVGIYSKNNPYGIDSNLVFSFPCQSNKEGRWEILPDFSIDSLLRTKLRITEKELVEERDAVRHLLRKSR